MFRPPRYQGKEGNAQKTHVKDKCPVVIAAAALARRLLLGAYNGHCWLTVGLWDHWVPTANAASAELIEEWAAKERVEVQIDYITTQGNKLLLTEHAEAQSRSGHDIMTFRWLGSG